VRAVTGNPQATAPQVLQETAMPFMQAVAPRPSGLLETPVKSDLGFYSALEQATIPLQNKGTGSQFLAQIEKTAGVKPEEVKWTGLDEFLKSRQNVTKQEVQDYLAANRVNLQEVRLGEPEAFDASRLAQLENEFKNLKQHPIDDPSFGQEKYDELIRLMNIKERSTTTNLYNRQESAMRAGQRAQARGMPEAAERYFREAELYGVRAEKLDLEGQGMMAPPKFEQYVLPGGENYREILLTLPQKNPEFDPADLGRLTELSNKTRTAAETEEYRALAQRYDASLRGETTPEFRSSHFDQPNILAHMRVNDRVVDGKKTLFIEEVQSDWHQAGRKKGYQTKDGRTPEQIEDELSVVMKTRSKLLEEAAALPDSEMAKFKVMNEEIKRLSEEAKKLDAEFYSVVDKKDKGVPDAPFKTTWHELSLKRAIQEASEKGYDQIAFTTGKTQAERYDLSKQVNKIDVEAVDEVPNLYFVDVDVTGGKKLNLEVENGVVRNEEFAGKPLEDVVGKEIAERVFAVQQGDRTRLQGDDLRIGGEGMKGFYDQILPKSLEKLGKKFDAKVGKTFIEGERTRDASGIPSMYPEKIEVWKMDITPKMRESVLTKGQPLFAATPALPALGLLGSEEE
jgi:hypothetical protein